MIEVADVFRRFGADYLSAHGASAPPSHRRAIENILDCRTAALGGQVWRCDAPPSSGQVPWLEREIETAASVVRAVLREAHQFFLSATGSSSKARDHAQRRFALHRRRPGRNARLDRF